LAPQVRSPTRTIVLATVSDNATSSLIRLGPVNTKAASANERPGAQGKADDAARTGRPGKKDNAAMRAGTLVPSGLPA